MPHTLAHVLPDVQPPSRVLLERIAQAQRGLVMNSFLLPVRQGLTNPPAICTDGTHRFETYLATAVALADSR